MDQLVEKQRELWMLDSDFVYASLRSWFALL